MGKTGHENFSDPPDNGDKGATRSRLNPKSLPTSPDTQNSSPSDRSVPTSKLIVDTLEVSFPIHFEFLREAFRRRPGVEKPTTRDVYEFASDDPRFFLRIFERRSHTGESGQEYETTGINAHAAFQLGSTWPPDLESVWEEICELVTPTVGIEQAGVTRLDVARNFTVAWPGWWIDRLARVPRGHLNRGGGTKQVVYSDLATGVPNYLRIGPKRGWGIKLYHRHPRPGRRMQCLRFEGEAKKAQGSGHLPRLGVHQVGDLTPEILAEVATSLFHQACFDVVLAPFDEFERAARRYARREGISERRIDSFLSYERARVDLAPPSISSSRRSAYNRWRREIGVHPASPRPTYLDLRRGAAMRPWRPTPRATRGADRSATPGARDVA